MNSLIKDMEYFRNVTIREFAYNEIRIETVANKRTEHLEHPHIYTNYTFKCNDAVHTKWRSEMTRAQQAAFDVKQWAAAPHVCVGCGGGTSHGDCHICPSCTATHCSKCNLERGIFFARSCSFCRGHTLTGNLSTLAQSSSTVDPLSAGAHAIRCMVRDMECNKILVAFHRTDTLFDMNRFTQRLVLLSGVQDVTIHTKWSVEVARNSCAHPDIVELFLHQDNKLDEMAGRDMGMLNGVLVFGRLLNEQQAFSRGLRMGQTYRKQSMPVVRIICPFLTSDFTQRTLALHHINLHVADDVPVDAAAALPAVDLGPAGTIGDLINDIRNSDETADAMYDVRMVKHMSVTFVAEPNSSVPYKEIELRMPALENINASLPSADYLNVEFMFETAVDDDFVPPGARVLRIAPYDPTEKRIAAGPLPCAVGDMVATWRFVSTDVLENMPVKDRAKVTSLHVYAETAEHTYMHTNLKLLYDDDYDIVVAKEEVKPETKRAKRRKLADA